MQRGWTPITDISRYEELLARVRALGLANHFPDVAPGNAIDFNYTPHFLQGPMILQLRCQIPENELDAVMNLVATHKAEAQNADRHVDPTAPRPYDYTADTGNVRALDSSFDMHMLYAEAHGQDAFSWNHGSYEGIAIDRANRVMLYFASAW
ncbi:MAG TPA: hypothetical protein VMM76_09830 [Pirellulaceae bacterium]|nr:hypothetical protein [Pirellulaceae bacterium]